MNPGLLDRIIEVTTMAIVTDATGGEIKTPQTYLQTRARVLYNKGSEKIDAEKETATSNVTFRIRWYTDITQSMEIVYDNDVYNIKSINEWGGRRAYLDLFTEKRI